MWEKNSEVCVSAGRDIPSGTKGFININGTFARRFVERTFRHPTWIPNLNKLFTVEEIGNANQIGYLYFYDKLEYEGDIYIPSS